MILLGLLVTALLTYVFIPLLHPIFSEQRRENFRGESIAVGMGIGFVIPAVVIWLFMDRNSTMGHTLTYAVALLAFALLGLVDDLLGNADQRGFGGHFQALLKGRLTTGALKALVGGVVAIGVSTQIAGQSAVVLNALLIVLSANFINILDLRPGRAGKAFVLFGAGLALFTRGSANLLNWLIAAVIGYLPWDLRGRVMMGDSGANALGAALGFAIALGTAELAKWVILVILVALNFLAERISFSDLISSNRILRYIDELGRSDK